MLFFWKYTLVANRVRIDESFIVDDFLFSLVEMAIEESQACCWNMLLQPRPVLLLFLRMLILNKAHPVSTRGKAINRRIIISS